VTTCIRIPRPPVDVWNHEVDDTVVMIGVGKLDQHPVRAERQVLDDDGVRLVPRQIVNGDTEGPMRGETASVAGQGFWPGQQSRTHLSK
jgi:hypothetical protein